MQLVTTLVDFVFEAVKACQVDGPIFPHSREVVFDFLADFFNPDDLSLHKLLLHFQILRVGLELGKHVLLGGGILRNLVVDELHLVQATLELGVVVVQLLAHFVILCHLFHLRLEYFKNHLLDLGLVIEPVGLIGIILCIAWLLLQPLEVSLDFPADILCKFSADWFVDVD